ncbi:MAG: PHP domain-containing protein, partial [Oscillospiraceae bacterium]|nr:PHP domain-containing protein [Oscillospiraceae bacterium]
MKSNFREMFESFLPNGLLEKFSNSEIQKISLAEEGNLVRVEVAFDFVPEFGEIFELERALSTVLEKRVRFSPSFNSELFSEAAVPYILDELKFRGKTVNGFFSGVTYNLSGDKLTLTLSHGGKDILEKNYCDGEIAKIIDEWFNVKTSVVFEENSEHIPATAEYVENIVYRNPEPVVPVEPKPKYKGNFTLPYSAEKPEMILGKMPVKNTPEPIANLGPQTENTTVWGDVFFVDSREIRNGESTIYNFYISDGTDSVVLEIFVKKDSESKVPSIREGDTLIVQGRHQFNDYTKTFVLKPTKIQKAERLKKRDDAKEKRVELHLHTSLSEQDGVSSPKSLIKQAHEWGHKAIAITDHGVVQAYPEAMNTVEDIWQKDSDFKVIYGMEGYYVDDSVNSVVGTHDSSLDDYMIVFDLETTGLNANFERITEIGAVKVKNGDVVETFNTFVNPERPIPPHIVELTSITDEMVSGAPNEKAALQMFYDFCGDCKILVAHNAPFDTGFLKATALRNNMPYDFTSIDTVPIIRTLYPELKRVTL